jgi:hypothetical protein
MRLIGPTPNFESPKNASASRWHSHSLTNEWAAFGLHEKGNLVSDWKKRAGDGDRTRDVQLGKLALN